MNGYETYSTPEAEAHSTAHSETSVNHKSRSSQIQRKTCTYACRVMQFDRDGGESIMLTSNEQKLGREGLQCSQ